MLFRIGDITGNSSNHRYQLKKILLKLKSALTRKSSQAGQAHCPARFAAQLRKLERRVHYRIRNRNLFIQAFKHRSYLHFSEESRVMSYERLEFLGDSILNLIAAEHLYHKFPSNEEGQLTKQKALMVNKKVLSRKARALGLGDLILMSESEDKAGGRNRSSITADVLEAVIGAVFLDRGYIAARNFVTEFIFDDLDAVLADEDGINFKGTLLELAQQSNWGIPVYSVIREVGPEHHKEFTVEVKIKNKVLGTGKGMSKKEAEQKSARIALQKLNQIPSNHVRN